MKLPLSIKTGLNWVIASLYLFGRYPGKWLGLALAYVVLFLMLPTVMPSLLSLVLMMFWPVFLALAMGLLREAAAGRETPLRELFEQIKPNFGRLLSLGGACLVYGTLVGFLTGDELQRLTDLLQQTGPEAMMPDLTPLLLKVMLLLVPLLMATWFAPMLIAYQGHSLLNALGQSLWASWRFMIPLGAAWLVLTLMLTAVMLLVGGLVALLSLLSSALGTLIMSLALLGCMLSVTSLMLAIQYFSYRGVFETPLIEAGK
ncbi:hypothetical protein ED236_07745 [Pseudomethylobacillus aquaticus]|uniref:DUF2189 domain-containing protein n=1 Tax=Pseudomethylobacillus aquaticus TaxID=2676064 RepID=A0A3N0V0T4_9PROT|nr:BPSS1780 family membrane protein [Pseudomethylobacillus aquaticus]ROH86315.1 hypothetical protein ED236_07745 [Pseudomethylobacillus aquaticus]